MAFRNSDGALHAYSLGDIFTIDPATGAATFLGSTGVGFQGGDARALSPSDPFTRQNQTALETIDQSTGQATSVADLTYPVASSRATGTKFDKETVTLYASVVSGTDSFQADYLATIDIATGLVRDVGPTVTGLEAIAIEGTDSAARAGTRHPHRARSRARCDGTVPLASRLAKQSRCRGTRPPLKGREKSAALKILLPLRYPLTIVNIVGASRKKGYPLKTKSCSTEQQKTSDSAPAANCRKAGKTSLSKYRFRVVDNRVLP